MLVCKITPETAKADPTVKAISILGILISQIIVELPELDGSRIVFNESFKVKSEGPTNIPKPTPVTVNMRTMIAQYTSLFKNNIPG